MWDTGNDALKTTFNEIADSEPEIKFNIVEKGGITIEKTLSRPNPIASEKCGNNDCEVCKQNGGKRNCQKCNCVYSYTCLEPGCRAKYIGESHNNLMTTVLRK